MSVSRKGVVLQPFHHLVLLLECQAANFSLVPSFFLALYGAEATVEVEATLEPAEVLEDTEEEMDPEEGSRKES